MKRVAEFFAEMLFDYATRQERAGRMSESLRERRQANIRAVHGFGLATGAAVAWLALKGVAMADVMAQSAFLAIIATGVGYLCLWLWILAAIKLGVAYRHSQ